jgi:hypothetical protein
VEKFGNLQPNSQETIEAFKQSIEKLADETYKEIAQRYGEHFGKNPKDIYWQHACFQFQTILREKLHQKGILSIPMESDVRSIVPNGKPHYTLLVKFLKNYIVDGTWQQYIEKEEIDEINKNNHCLIADSELLEQDLRMASVPKRLWFIYQNRVPTRSKSKKA